MIKDLKYYLNLKYPIEVRELSADEGGGYMAVIPQLSRNTFVGDGETIQEAIDNLNETKKEWFEDFLKKGLNIPEPIK